MDPSSSADRELDLRGEVCPYTFVRAKLALEGMPVGAALTLLVDHEPATRNIPRSAAEWGQEVRSVGPVDCAESAQSAGPAAGGTWRIVLVKRRD